MAVPIRPLAAGIVVAIVIAAVLILMRPGSVDGWKYGLAVIGLVLFVLAGLGGKGGAR